MRSAQQRKIVLCDDLQYVGILPKVDVLNAGLLTYSWFVQTNSGLCPRSNFVKCENGEVINLDFQPSENG